MDWNMVHSLMDTFTRTKRENPFYRGNERSKSPQDTNFQCSVSFSRALCDFSVQCTKTKNHVISHPETCMNSYLVGLEV